MNLEEGEVYHIFNRGNNRQRVFLRSENYLFFLRGIERYLKPYSDILAYCLMPNHFHLLIHANFRSVEGIVDGSFPRQRFSQGIKQLLSSYTKAVNKETGRTGSLFQQKTKAVCVSNSRTHDGLIAFHYIHQNPMRANLVSKMEDWEYSSFRDYIGKPSSTICNQKLAVTFLDIDLKTFYEESYQVVNYKSDV